MKLWNILLWMVRQALSFVILEESDQHGEKAKRDLGLRTPNPQPFRNLAERFRNRGAHRIAARFLERDAAMKSGEIRGSDEHPEEVLAVMEREILELTS